MGEGMTGTGKNRQFSYLYPYPHFTHTRTRAGYPNLCSCLLFAGLGDTFLVIGGDNKDSSLHVLEI